VTRALPLPAATSTAPLALSWPGRHRPRSRRRGLLVALLLAVTALAALPALAGGLGPWVGERPQAPFAIPVPHTTAPADEPATRPADQPGPPAPADQSLADDQPDRRGDDRDRGDDSSGPGSGGDGSGGGGSTGPG